MMRLYSKDDIEIAWSATARTDLAFAGYTHVYTIIYASWNIDYHAAIVPHPTLATALFTGSGNVASFPTTALTHRHIDELPKDRLFYTTNLASSLTRRTTRCRRTGLRAAAATIGTGLPAGQFNFLLTTKDGFLECDGKIIAKISTTLGSSTALGARRSRKESFEEIIDAAERAKVAKVAKACAPAIADSGMSIAIIGGTFLRITQYLIGLVDFNKTGFRSLLFIGIRVILLGKAAECFLYFLIACAARYPQYFIIISFASGH